MLLLSMPRRQAAIWTNRAHRQKRIQCVLESLPLRKADRFSHCTTLASQPPILRALARAASSPRDRCRTGGLCCDDDADAGGLDGLRCGLALT